eukprot:ctg_4751.g681
MRGGLLRGVRPGVCPKRALEPASAGAVAGPCAHLAAGGAEVLRVLAVVRVVAPVSRRRRVRCVAGRVARRTALDGAHESPTAAAATGGGAVAVGAAGGGRVSTGSAYTG